MKKFLSVVLAVAMIVSLASVAMAKNPNFSDAMSAKLGDLDGAASSHKDAFTVKVDDNKVYYPVVDMVGPFSFNSEDRALYSADNYGSNDTYCGPIEYGDVAYYALVQFMVADAEDGDEINDRDAGYYSLVTESETVSGLKIKAKWEEGEDMVKKISIVKKKIANGESRGLKYSEGDVDDPVLYYPTAGNLGLEALGYEEDGYYYFLTISYEDSTSVNDTDVIGTITMNKSKDPSVDDLEFDLGVNLDWENSWRDNGNANYEQFEIKGDPNFDIKTDTNYALKFNCDDEVEFTFEDDSTFTVDVSGQGKILFNFNTEYNNKIGNKYAMRQGAELNFWNGNGAKFNRVGEFFLSCEDLEGTQFLYQVNADGTLSEVPGAEWDDSDEGFYFNTRVLGTYVISDMELDIAPVVSAPVATPSAPAVSAPVISNPSTGAAA